MQVLNNKTNLQFEVYQNESLAVLQYRLKDNTIYFMHTGVPKELEGKGIGSTLAKFGLDYAKNNGYKIVVYCPFVVQYVKEHREYLKLLNEKYQSKERFI